MTTPKYKINIIANNFYKERSFTTFNFGILSTFVLDKYGIVQFNFEETNTNFFIFQKHFQTLGTSAYFWKFSESLGQNIFSCKRRPTTMPLRSKWNQVQLFLGIIHVLLSVLVEIIEYLDRRFGISIRLWKWGYKFIPIGMCLDVSLHMLLLLESFLAYWTKIRRTFSTFFPDMIT